jgi:hypothetical protein
MFFEEDGLRNVGRGRDADVKQEWKFKSGWEQFRSALQEIA